MVNSLVAQRRAEVELADKRRIVALDLLKTWTFAFTTTSFLAPMFRPDGDLQFLGYAIIFVCLVIQALMIWFAKWVR